MLSKCCTTANFVTTKFNVVKYKKVYNTQTNNYIVLQIFETKSLNLLFSFFYFRAADETYCNLNICHNRLNFFFKND